MQCKLDEYRGQMIILQNTTVDTTTMSQIDFPTGEYACWQALSESHTQCLNGAAVVTVLISADRH